MKVVLLENVKGIGSKGDIKDVKDGYAMNFLIPQGKVVRATGGNIRNAELQKEKNKEAQKQIKIKAKEMSDKINGQKIEIKAKVQGDKLFGALTEKDIDKALRDNSLVIEGGKIKMEKIKSTGEHKIAIEWLEDIRAELVVVVKGK